ncbi:hypothetical protein N8I71_15415 [Roseibacterium sp. SDUM158016]|jgi:hypothetical protein|nr:hypothetical protein [Roseibacterium sp. SDUM158016]MCU4654232.1 hypothetical protein [Roseibacterium sp. SDUM158016]
MIARIADILTASRATLAADAFGVAAIAAMTLALLHLPALV